MKRILVIILMASVACAAFARGGTETNAAGLKSKVTLTFYSDQSFPITGPSGIQTDDVSKAITAATGVVLDVDMSPTPDKTNVMVASGTLPDIYMLNNNANCNPLIKSSSVLDLTSLLASNGSNISKVAARALQYSKDYLSNGTGKVYYVPGRVDIGDASSIYYNPVIGFFMRLDYYKKIGSPVLKSFDDAANAIIAIQKKYPTTADGKPTYAFSMWQDWGLWHYTVLSQVIRSIGSVPGLGGQVAFLDGSDLSFMDGLTDNNSPTWVDTKFYNKLYQAGIMDPNSFTQGYAQASTTMSNGQVICQAAQWLADAVNPQIAKDNPTNADAGYVSIILQGAKYNSSNYAPIGFASFWAISSKCTAPDRAMDVINYLFSEEGSRTLLTGVKGDIWTTDATGKAVLTDKGLTIKNQTDFMASTGIRKYQNNTGIDMYSKDSKGRYLDLFFEPDVLAKTLTPLAKSWLSTYNVASSDELFHKMGGITSNMAFNAMMEVPPEDVMRLDAKIVGYMQTALPKLTMSKTDAAYEVQKQQMIKDIQAMDGYQAYMDWAKSAIQKAATAAAKYK
jgi:putative aldouronate transport system substrate-binding protein